MKGAGGVELKIGQQVGAFTYLGVRYGKIEEIRKDIVVIKQEKSCGIEIHKNNVFPVWKGNYTKEDAMRLAKTVKSLGCNILASDIRNLDNLDMCYYQSVLRELETMREQLSKDVADAPMVELIDKFLYWAAHGFPAVVRDA